MNKTIAFLLFLIGVTLSSCVRDLPEQTAKASGIDSVKSDTVTSSTCRVGPVHPGGNVK